MTVHHGLRERSRRALGASLGVSLTTRVFWFFRVIMQWF